MDTEAVEISGRNVVIWIELQTLGELVGELGSL